jgi:vacuolar iron transporter family protein
MEQSRQPHAAHRKRIERAQSGTARAALLGVSDGLVTNISLILGVVGAGTSANIVRIAGLASLIAGACSMAVGEYISMRGQAELLESVLDVERAELRSNPEITCATLQELLTADGVSADTAAKASAEISRDPEKAMGMYARGQLGVNPDELGSPWGSAASSLVTFSLGAFVPLVPWFFASGTTAALTSCVLAVISALLIGGYLGSVTTGRPTRTAVRQLIVLILAAAATYLIGRLLHTQVT